MAKARSMSDFRAVHEGCGGEVFIEDDGGCSDSDCCGGTSAPWLACRKCGKKDAGVG